MKRGIVHSLLLLFALATVGPATENRTQKSILIGNIELSLGMPRDAVLEELRTRTNYLLTKLGHSAWVVSDKKVIRAVAILSFDRYGRLWRVQKNWTPAVDCSMSGKTPLQVVSAMAFAQELYKLAEQMPDEDSGSGLHSCTLSVSRRLPVGPYAWLRDPGQPDIEVREVDLTCTKETIQLYIDQPTDATRSNAGILGIEKVLLYESIGGASK